MQRLVANLRALRTRHDLTQERLAEMASISYKWYQSIENARQEDVRLSTIDRIAALFSLEAKDLISETLPDTQLSPVKAVDPPHYKRRRSKG